MRLLRLSLTLTICFILFLTFFLLCKPFFYILPLSDDYFSESFYLDLVQIINEEKDYRKCENIDKLLDQSIKNSNNNSDYLLAKIYLYKAMNEDEDTINSLIDQIKHYRIGIYSQKLLSLKNNIDNNIQTNSKKKTSPTDTKLHLINKKIFLTENGHKLLYSIDYKVTDAEAGNTLKQQLVLHDVPWQTIVKISGISDCLVTNYVRTNLWKNKTKITYNIEKTKLNSSSDFTYNVTYSRDITTHCAYNKITGLVNFIEAYNYSTIDTTFYNTILVPREYNYDVIINDKKAYSSGEDSLYTYFEYLPIQNTRMSNSIINDSISIIPHDGINWLIILVSFIPLAIYLICTMYYISRNTNLFGSQVLLIVVIITFGISFYFSKIDNTKIINYVPEYSAIKKLFSIINTDAVILIQYSLALFSSIIKYISSRNASELLSTGEGSKNTYRINGILIIEQSILVCLQCYIYLILLNTNHLNTKLAILEIILLIMFIFDIKKGRNISKNSNWTTIAYSLAITSILYFFNRNNQSVISYVFLLFTFILLIFFLLLSSYDFLSSRIKNQTKKASFNSNIILFFVEITDFAKLHTPNLDFKKNLNKVIILYIVLCMICMPFYPEVGIGAILTLICSFIIAFKTNDTRIQT